MRSHLELALEASQKAEAELRGREERLHSSLDAANVGTWEWNIRTGAVRWSENLERIHGQARGTFRGTFDGFLDGVHPDDRQRVIDAIQRALMAGESYEIEYRSLLPDGTVKWFEGRGRVIRDSGGVPAWMSGICMDATERHRLTDEYRQTQRLESLGLLAGGIAHDFNNLLVGIMGNASLALETLSPASTTAPMLRDVLAASERAAQLTRKLLAYAGKGHSAPEPTNLTALVRELSALLRTSIPKRVQVALDLDEDLPCVFADPAQLQQVVMNLVINAAEAIPDRTPGAVIISTSCKAGTGALVVPDKSVNGCVELSVRDNGCGMDPATQARIFDPFYTTKFAGRGLGLSAVMGIVRGHGGTVAVQSVPGEGTCFTVVFPAVSEEARRQNDAMARQVRRGSETILVVDDERAVCEMAARALEYYGYRVLVAGDGSEAVRKVAEHPEIRAVLLDYAMPELDGAAVKSRIQALRPGLPIVLSSGYAEHEAVLSPLDGACAAFLPKPYSVRCLVEKIECVLDRGV